MKRGIFRAKRIEKDPLTGKYEWVYGAYLQFDKINYCFVEETPDDNVIHYIFSVRQGDWNMNNAIERVEVDGNTVRQYTGWADKKGRPIYEGDDMLIGDKRLKVVFDTNEGCFALRLFLPNENRVTYIYPSATFMQQYERIEEEL